ncbi:RluA family pseudouridine synthase [Tepidanaerobacter sp. GT38]|uniref:RluA family pseudouridine synthase n=1 Tax=Tepidanaerobacter sp. GT38 TaxID=2722793 RepID=UPI001F483831|nr:RluA family pseudouridine synthase [Tepidanaerobacter sp. GT38]MCG1012092.1 RluA family pseudouridine synthase [Tepidanaerobacter sp. GT38]
MSHKHEITIAKEDARKRLDVFLAENLQESRSFLQKGILEGWVKVNGAVVKPNYKLKEKDHVSVDVPPPPEPSITPENIPLDIIYEDKDILVVNKPRGMVVYPAPGNYSGTLINAVLSHTKDLSARSGLMRPGIVHRLDKDTSGAIVLAKTDNAHMSLSRQFKNRQVTKVYYTLVWGNVKEDKATINAPIGRHDVKRTKMQVASKSSREAVTHFKVIERFNDFTFLEVTIETGRTHQIRVHMQFIGHPVVADPVYSRKKPPFNIKGQALHAYKLGFCHPSTGKYMEFTAPIPDDMNSILEILRKEKMGE